MNRLNYNHTILDIGFRCLIAALTILGLVDMPIASANSSQPKPLHVQFSAQQIEAIQLKVENAKLPSPLPGESWATGPTSAYMNEFQQYWLKNYSWKATEERINQFDNYHVNIEGEAVHYLIESGSGDKPTPIVLLHGWPHNFMSFLDVIKPLAHPESFGAKAQQSYTVVVVSLPGSGLSEKPSKPIGPKAMARRIHTLMTDVLGFDNYAIHGGDWGALIGSWMAAEHPEAVSMLHLNHALLRPHNAWLGSGNIDALHAATAQEVAHMQSEEAAFASPTATYFPLQSARPKSIAYALSDSPMGTAAWYLDKYVQWVDTSNRSFEQTLTKQVLLDQIMLTLLTDTVDSAMWIYNGAAIEMPWTLPENQKVKVPTVFAAFPDPFITPPPQELIMRSYNLVDFQQREEGGHWPMMERPDLFIQSLRNAQRDVLKINP